MSIVPKSFVDDLRARLRLSDVAGKRLKLSRAGREFKACCPFHNEKTPSFYINDEKGFYHCFGCGAHGDVVGFVMRFENRSFMDTIEDLAAQAGLQVPRPTPQQVERTRGRERLISLMECATNYFNARLYEQADVLDYVQGRGLDEATIRSFRLGYSPANSHSLIEALKKSGYTEAEIIDVGLARRSDRDGSLFAFFRDRLMFPVTDRRGQTIAFGARVLPEHLRPLKQGAPKPPKYINSGETPIFQKGHILYNESHARTAAARGEPVIVCEGYADVISLWQAGFTGAVAPLGTALTESQIAALWSMLPSDATTGIKAPILCFDGDSAGTRAAARAMDRILPQLQAGRSARFAFIADGMDPDDLIRAKGPGAFQAVLDRALPMADMIWSSLTQNKRFDTPEGRAALQRAMHETCAQIADLTLQKQYESELKSRFWDAFGKKGGQKGVSGRKNAPPPVKLPNPKAGAAHIRACTAIGALLNYPEIFDQAEDLLGRIELADSPLDGLRQAILSILADTPEADKQTLHDTLAKKGLEQDMHTVLDISRIHGAPPPEKGGNALLALEALKEALGHIR